MFKKKTVAGLCNQFTNELDGIVAEQYNSIDTIHAGILQLEKQIDTKKDLKRDAELELSSAQNAISNIKQLFGV